MRAAGKTSDRSRSGIDVSGLAKGAGVSYEMARRYAEGLAMPRPDVIDQIAAWLHMDPAVLAWGTAAPGEVDLHALERCLQALRAAEAVSGVSVSPDSAARIVAQLYTEMRQGEVPSTPTLAAMLRATKAHRK